MKSNIVKPRFDKKTHRPIESLLPKVIISNETNQKNWFQNGKIKEENTLPELLFITSYPPRECGIATYSHDLITALNNKFGTSFAIKVCAMESGKSGFEYSKEVINTLDTTDPADYEKLAIEINKKNRILNR